jgi:periplasmic divalent cation tolerance protein
VTSTAAVVLTTVGSADDAARLARAMVEQHAAACVNIIAPVRSVYRWEGEVVDEGEWLLLCKTTARGAAALKNALLARHPYQLPEVLVIEAGQLSDAYAAWLEESVSS